MKPDHQSWMNFSIANLRFPLVDEFLSSGENLEENRDDGFFESATQLVRGKVLIDVTDTCSTDTNTGIQRVVRNLCRELYQDGKEILFVSWCRNEQIFRTLTPAELYVTIGHYSKLQDLESFEKVSPDGNTFVIPSECIVFVPELAWQHGRIDRLVSMAKYSSNEVAVIAYDAVPLVIPSTTAEGMPGMFANQLRLFSVAKYIFAISESTSKEVNSLLEPMRKISKSNAEIYVTPLPIVGINRESAIQPKSNQVAQLIVVGTHEPRKNHTRLLFAAKALWDEGLLFELRFYGSKGWNSQLFWRNFHQMKRKGYSVFSNLSASDQELSEAYLNAKALVFPSLHEGFGLPIAEAITYNLPVITSSIGSMGDLADSYHLRKIDPYSVNEMKSAMRDALNGLLSIPTTSLPTSYPLSWKEYSESLWQKLVHNELSK
jgi:glycosyltransferase involved in cell wall biosynthesis